MIKKNYKFLAVLLMSILVLESCEEKNDIIGQLELVQFNQAGTVEVFIPDEDNFTFPIGIALVSTPLPEDVTVNFEVGIPDNLQNDLAIEDVHFRIPKTITIPAGQVYTELMMEGIFDGFSGAEEITEFQLTITSATNATLFENTSLKVRMQLSCDSDLGGVYSSLMDGDVGDSFGGSAQTYSDLPTTVTLTDLGDGIYSIDDMSFGLYPIGYADTAPSGRIMDGCDVISDLGDTDQYGDPFTINGVVNEDGTINISWSNTYGDTGTGLLTPQ